MESKHLIYLSVILDKGSITAAAEHLNIAQPTLTRAMATLEMQAGTLLFTRSRFGVSSTPVGESLAREGRAIIRRLDSAKEQVSRHKLGIKQNLRIAVGPLITMKILPLIIDRVLAKHPEITLTVTSLNPSASFDGLMDDQFDITIAPQPSDRNSTNIYKELVIKDKVGIFCGNNHPLADKKNIQIEDFVKLDWISLGISHYFEKQTTEILRSYGIYGTKTKVVFRNDATILMSMLASGNYLAALPTFPVSTIKDTYAIQEIFPKDVALIERDIYIMCTESLKEQPAFHSFKEITQQIFKELAAQRAQE